MPTVWTDEQIARWTILAEEDIVRRVSLRYEPFSLAITAGEGTYTINSRIKEIISVLWKGRPLLPLIGQEPHAYRHDFRTLESSLPQYYSASNDGISTLRIIPVPSVSIDEYTDGLEGENVKNAFIIRARTYPDRTVDNFQIPAYYQRNLVKCFVLKTAFRAEGIGQNLRASSFWAQRYEQYIGALVNAKSKFYSTQEELDQEWCHRDQKKRFNYRDTAISGHVLRINAAWISESLNNWADEVLISLAADPSIIQIDVADDLNNWADELTSALTETQIQVNVSDDLNSWNDSVGAALLGDQNIEVSDSLNNWNDSVSQELTGSVPQPDSTWLFDDGSGTTVTDSSGALDGTTPGTGETWVTAGLQVVQDPITIGDNYNQDGTQPFSVSIVCESDNTGVSRDYIGKQINGGTQRKGWIFYHDDDDLYFEIISDNSTGERLLVRTTTNVLADNAWHHLVVTYDGSAAPAGITFYIDGSSVAHSTVVDNLLGSSSNTDPMCLGGRQVPSSRALAGTIGIIRFWDGVELDSGDVSSWYATDQGIMSGRGVTI